MMYRKRIQEDTVDPFIAMKLSAGVFRPRDQSIFLMTGHKEVYCMFINHRTLKVKAHDSDFGYHELWYLCLSTSSIPLRNIAITFLAYRDLPYETARLRYMVDLPLQDLNWVLATYAKEHFAYMDTKTGTLNYLLNYANKESLVRVKALIDERLAAE